MSLYLVFSDGIKRVEKRIPAGKEAEIGRGKGYKVEVRYGEKVEIVDMRDATMSKKHARIFWKDKKPYLQDLGSKNGTKIDGGMIPGWKRKKESEAVPLVKGSKILFGSMTMASVEAQSNTLTLTEGDSFRLTKEEMKLLIENSGVKIAKKEGEMVIEDVKKDVRIEADGRKVHMEKNPENRMLQKMLTKLLSFQIELHKKDLNGAISQWNIIEKEYKKTICAIDERVYKIIKRDMEECEEGRAFKKANLDEIMKELEKMTAYLKEEVIEWK